MENSILRTFICSSFFDPNRPLAIGHWAPLVPQTVLALKGSDGVVREWLWFLRGSVHCGGRYFLLLFVAFGTTYPSMHNTKQEVLSNRRYLE